MLEYSFTASTAFFQSQKRTLCTEAEPNLVNSTPYSYASTLLPNPVNN